MLIESCKFCDPVSQRIIKVPGFKAELLHCAQFAQIVGGPRRLPTVIDRSTTKKFQCLRRDFQRLLFPFLFVGVYLVSPPRSIRPGNHRLETSAVEPRLFTNGSSAGRLGS